MEKMFCYQCEQTASCRGCTGAAGVCGKRAEAANLQDDLTGALIGLARAFEGNAPSEADRRLIEDGLFATVTNVNFDEAVLADLIERVRAARDGLARRCGGCKSPCGRNEDYEMRRLWAEPDEDLRSLKSLLLFGLRGMAAYAHHARALGYGDEAIDAFFGRGLRAVGADLDASELLELALELGRVNLTCMELLDRAHVETFGAPAPAEVPTKIAKGPFIVVTGHDLNDLRALLEQTAGKGVNVYTHGEMLPAHGYPALRAFPHLKGHLGAAWQNQQREFDALPAPILFTTNCLMPPKASYADRVFVPGPVAYPGARRIGAERDFSPLVATALALGGYGEDRPAPGANGGICLQTGWGHGAILERAEEIVAAVRSGALKRFFLVGGCDGARPERGYFTQLVQLIPRDCAVLTLACGKFRFNHLDLGEIGDLPRLMDLGQCNDAYGAVRVAAALAETFGCGVNDLPLSLVLSWYEQKAVCILLSLLALGITNIRIGPTLPAFLSPGVRDVLAKRYGLTPTGAPEADLAQMLAGH